MADKFFSHTLHEAKDTTLVLFKIVIPVLIIIKVLEEFGFLKLINNVLNPLMGAVGLPDAMGVIWLTAIFTNIYAAMILFFELAQQQDITVAQSTIMCTMILIAHSLPIEGSIAHKTGVRFTTNIMFRFLSAYALGFILNQIYSYFNLYQQKINLIWQPEVVDKSIADWLLVQFYNLLAIAIIIFVVILIMNLIKNIGIEELLLKPVIWVLRAIGIDKQTASFNFVGLILGISYGAGILIKESKQKHIDQRHVASSMMFLSLSHAVIEDTLLMLTLGASLSGILLARIIFTLLIIYWFNRVILKRHLWFDKLVFSK